MRATNSSNAAATHVPGSGTEVPSPIPLLQRRKSSPPCASSEKMPPLSKRAVDTQVTFDRSATGDGRAGGDRQTVGAGGGIEPCSRGHTDQVRSRGAFAGYIRRGNAQPHMDRCVEGPDQRQKEKRYGTHEGARLRKSRTARKMRATSSPSSSATSDSLKTGAIPKATSAAGVLFRWISPEVRPLGRGYDAAANSSSTRKRNCPQAASISWPFSRRMVATTPPARTARTNSC